MSLSSVWSRNAVRRLQVPDGVCATISWFPLLDSPDPRRNQGRISQSLCQLIDNLRPVAFEQFCSNASLLSVMIVVPANDTCTRCVWDADRMKKLGFMVEFRMPSPNLAEWESTH